MELMAVIREKFNLRSFEANAIKDADMTLLSTEARDLMPYKKEHWLDLPTPLSEKIQPVPPREAKQMFLDRYYYLEGKRK